MILVITPERTHSESAYGRSGTRDIGWGDPPKAHQSVTPTGRRSGRLGGFSKAVLGHQVVFLASGLADRGSSTVRPSGRVYSAFLY